MARRSVIHALGRAVRNLALVRVERSCEPRPLPGYAVGLGEWLLLHVLNYDSMVLNGYSAVKVSDVRKVTRLADEYEGFMVKALRARKVRPKAQPRVSLQTTRHLLETSAQYFPLITIHEEKRDSEVCWIGRPAGFPGASVEMREVSPAGRWHMRPSRYQLRSITKIDFGGAYEDALARVALE
jgi:hypothetical protein